MDLDNLLDDFVHYLLVIRDLTKSTAYAYILDVKTYIQFFESEIDGSLESFRIEPELIHKYLYYLKNRNLCGATIQRRLIGLSRFWSYLYRSGLSSPPVSLDDMDIKVKNHRNPVKPLGEVDYQRMIMGLDHVFLYAKKFRPFTG